MDHFGEEYIVQRVESAELKKVSQFGRGECRFLLQFTQCGFVRHFPSTDSAAGSAHRDLSLATSKIRLSRTHKTVALSFMDVCPFDRKALKDLNHSLAC
jgi:hypothetical protein